MRHIRISERRSLLHGHGTFADEPIPKGIIFETQDLHYGYNYSDRPNAVPLEEGVIALRNIRPDEEITFPYYDDFAHTFIINEGALDRAGLGRYKSHLSKHVALLGEFLRQGYDLKTALKKASMIER